MKQGFHCSSCRDYSGLHLGAQDKDDFEALAQPLLWDFRKALCAFAPLRETRLRGPVSRKGAKAQRRKVRKEPSLNTQMQTAVPALTRTSKPRSDPPWSPFARARGKLPGPPASATPRSS